MTGTTLIQLLNRLVGDSAELSDSEALDLLNRKYTDVQNDRPWEWLKATATGTTSTSVPYIALPSDFKMMAPNSSGNQGLQFGNSGVPLGYTGYIYEPWPNVSVVFVGTEYQPYRVIPFEQRRNFIDSEGFCYIDIVNQRLYFTLQPTSVKVIEYDYIKVAPAITAGTSPIFSPNQPSNHAILAYGAAVEFPSLEQAEGQVNYAAHYQRQYDKILTDLAYEDANLKLAQS